MNEKTSDTKNTYPCLCPHELYSFFGFSCYRIESDIKLAIDKGIKNLELRPSAVNFDRKRLAELINAWRECGGKNLSIHLPDISYRDDTVIPGSELDSDIELAEFLKADRFTQHVPAISVRTAREDEKALPMIADYLADRINSLDSKIVVGVENMHMTGNEVPDDTRRFGYIPEECLEFMNLLDSKCRCTVGINFDFGHAYNNAPYSDRYPISTWLTMLGKYAVGYHVHQVVSDDTKLFNHMPITDFYGKEISYDSLFRCWNDGETNKAPLIFEMRPEGAYDTTLSAFSDLIERF